MRFTSNLTKLYALYSVADAATQKKLLGLAGQIGFCRMPFRLLNFLGDIAVHLLETKIKIVTFVVTFIFY